MEIKKIINNESELYENVDFCNKNCLVIGGLGMIGSHLARKLVDAGAKVTILAKTLHFENINNIVERVNVVVNLEESIKNQDYIFHLGGQVSHIYSITNPIDDLKHRIHGMKIFGKTIYLPKWLMRGSGDPKK